ncbi:hypothetical protein MBLNU13_g07255t1 [Cladosporium sp. NU13]
MELESVAMAADVYGIGVEPPGAIEELDTKLDPWEETWRLELVRLADGMVAAFEDTSALALLDMTVSDLPVLALVVGKALELEPVRENVKSDVDPFVVTQP